MLRATRWRYCMAPVYRTLNASEILAVVQEDRGETAAYYAKRYFGPKTERQVQHLLWTDLKKNGHVDIIRADMDAPPRWFPTANFAPKAPRVLKYRAEDYDLSVLKMENDLGRSQEHDVVSALQGGTQRAFGAEPKAAGKGDWQSDLAALAGDAKVLEEVVGEPKQAVTDGKP